MNSDGTIVAIGAPENDGNKDRAGHVRVYQYSNDVWVQLGADIDGEANEDHSGSAISLSSNGLILAISAIMNDPLGSSTINNGHVKVYEYTNGSWSQKGEDVVGVDEKDYQFSTSVSLSADGLTLFTSSINQYNSQAKGEVRVWKFVDGVWSRLGGNINGKNDGDNMGFSLSANDAGTRFIAGSVYNNDANDNAGQARVYELQNNSSWQQVGNSFLGDRVDDWYGGSVSMNSTGSIVAVTSRGGDASDSCTNCAPSAGYTKVYQSESNNLDSGTWSQVGNTIYGTRAGDLAGPSQEGTNRWIDINADGTRLIIGAEFYSGADAGQVRIFNFNSSTSTWDLLGEPINGKADFENSGIAVNISDDGTKVLIGAPSYQNSSALGKARIYEYND